MNPSRMSFRRVSTIRIAIEKTAAPWCIPRKRQRLANWLLTVIAIMVSTCVIVVSASAQSYTILYNFPGGIAGLDPGGLTIDASGRLYGSTIGGGNGAGTVFRLSRAGSGWVLTTLYAFRGTSDDRTWHRRVWAGWCTLRHDFSGRRNV